jgi:hypothetical protein
MEGKMMILHFMSKPGLWPLSWLGGLAIMRCVIPRGSGNFLAKIPYYIMRVNCISILIAIFI